MHRHRLKHSKDESRKMWDHSHSEGRRGGRHRHRLGDLKKYPMLALVGNPNVGKSVVFGHLTRRYVVVSNYPGTTVEIARGAGRVGYKVIEVVDTPGVNSLLPMSEDEQVTRDVLLMERPDWVLQVADAKNLLRTLLLTSQLIEMDLPIVLDLNMIDEAEQRRISIDVDRLAEILGVPVVTTTATNGIGIPNLKRSITNALESKVRIDYGEIIESALGQIETILESPPISARSIGLMTLAGENSIRGWIEGNYGEDIAKQIDDIARSVKAKYNVPLNYIIAQIRQREMEKIVQEVISSLPQKTLLNQKISELTMRPLTGIPIFLAVLYLVFKFVGEFGAGTLVDLMENKLFGGYINPWIAHLLEIILPIPILQEALVGEYGLITVGLTYAVALVMPIVGTFFLAFGILEDSGYFPRLTIMADRIFKKMGLNGKAALPMILGLGCDTMATLSTRILETKKERIIATLLLALGIPCSAQLGVIIGMLSWIGTSAIILVFSVVALQLFLVGYLASKILPGETSDFILEIPPLRVPKLYNILIKTYTRVEWFLIEAVPLFLMGTFVLFVFHKIGLLAFLEQSASPIISGLLDLPPEGVKGFLLGFLRRDYGAAGFYQLAREGKLDHIQMIVSLVVITLFVPCIANFFVIIKERGFKTAIAIVAFIIPYSILVGAILNWILRALGVVL